MWMSRSQFFSIRKNEGLEGTDDGNLCKSNPRVAVCTHLYALSIGNSVGCNEGLLRQKNVKWLIVLQRYQHLRCRCHPNGSKYSALPLNGSLLLNGSHGLSTPKLSQFLHLAFVALYIHSSNVLLDVYKF